MTPLIFSVSPPWDERGFELAGRGPLQAEFPDHHELIRALTVALTARETRTSIAP